MANKPKFEGVDRRGRYRLSSDTKILVQRVSSSSSQVGTIVNMTRNGLYFEVFGDYEPGMELHVWFPYDPTKPPAGNPQRAQVVRVQEIEGSMKKGVAIKVDTLFLKATGFAPPPRTE